MYQAIPAPIPSFRRKPESSAFAAAFVHISCRFYLQNRRRNGTKQLRHCSGRDLSTRRSAAASHSNP